MSRSNFILKPRLAAITALAMTSQAVLSVGYSSNLPRPRTFDLPKSTLLTQGRDAATVRAEGHREDLSDKERGTVFVELRKLADDESSPPAQRCLDAADALAAQTPVNAQASAKYVEDLRKAKWVSLAPPAARGWLIAQESMAFVAAGDADGALEILKDAGQLELQNKDASTLVNVAKLLAGRMVESNETIIPALKNLESLVPDSGVSEKLRAEAAAQIIAAKIELGESPTEVRVLCDRFLPLADGPSEAQGYLKLLIGSVDLLAPDQKNHWPRNLGQVADDSVKDVQAAETKYGVSSRMASRAALTLVDARLQMTFTDPKEKAEVLSNTLQIIDQLKINAKQLVEPERLGIMKIAFQGLLGDPKDAISAYRELGDIPSRPLAGQRYAARLTVLRLLQSTDPNFVASEWQQAMVAFASSIRGIANKDANLALTSLNGWQMNWSMYECIPQGGHVQEFLEGYVRATGIVKNLPFGKNGTDGQVQRIFGDVSLADVKKAVPASGTMIVFVKFDDPYGAGASYGGFCLDRTGPPRFKSLGPASIVDNAIKSWGLSMKGDREDERKGDPKQTGADLYNLLLKPLVGDRPPQKMIIVPDGEIGKLSFAGTVTPASKWLTEVSTISYLGAMRDMATSTTADGIGTPSVALYAGKSLGLKEPKLSINALLKLDQKAQGKPLTSTSLASLHHPHILQISTHGHFDQAKAKNPTMMSSAASISVPFGKEERKVTAREVAKWDLRGTDLAVLSSCDGARANVLVGEGTGGLRRGLYLAGARQVIAALSVVYAIDKKEQAPGDLLLSYVYEGLAQHLSPAESLREAQRKMIKNNVKPFQWAGFICEGPSR